jgi:hypothetical protein
MATVRRLIGYLFAAGLAVVSAWSIVCGWQWPFRVARNSDGAWHWETLAAANLVLRFGGVGSALGLAAYACLPSRRTAAALAALLLAVLLPPVCGCACGSFLWQREFDGNRRQAEAIIRALEEYRQQHGGYPGSLADLPRPPATTFRRGDNADQLEYRSWGPGGFLLEYGDGWYTYTYDSGTGKWEARD